MPLILAAERIELRKLDRSPGEADHRLPEAVQARKDACQRGLAEAEAVHHLAASRVDVDRIAWLDVGLTALAEAIAGAAQFAQELGVPITTELLMQSLDSLRGEQ
jgi:hypothetical protein